MGWWKNLVELNFKRNALPKRDMAVRFSGSKSEIAAKEKEDEELMGEMLNLIREMYVGIPSGSFRIGVNRLLWKQIPCFCFFRGFCEKETGFRDPGRYTPMLLLSWLESVDEVPDDLQFGCHLDVVSNSGVMLESHPLLGWLGL